MINIFGDSPDDTFWIKYYRNLTFLFPMMYMGAWVVQYLLMGPNQDTFTLNIIPSATSIIIYLLSFKIKIIKKYIEVIVYIIGLYISWHLTRNARVIPDELYKIIWMGGIFSILLIFKTKQWVYIFSICVLILSYFILDVTHNWTDRIPVVLTVFFILMLQIQYKIHYLNTERELQQEIIKNKLFENQVSELYDFQSSITNNLPIMFFIVNVDYNLIFISDEYCNKNIQIRNWCIGKNVNTFFTKMGLHSKKIEIYMKLIDTCFQSKEKIIYKNLILNPIIENNETAKVIFIQLY